MMGLYSFKLAHISHCNLDLKFIIFWKEEEIEDKDPQERLCFFLKTEGRESRLFHHSVCRVLVKKGVTQKTLEPSNQVFKQGLLLLSYYH